MLFGKKKTSAKDASGESKKSVLRQWVDAGVFAIIAATLVRTFVFEAYAIPSGSMEGTMLIHDHLFVSKLAYGPRLPMTPLAVPLADVEGFMRQKADWIVARLSEAGELRTFAWEAGALLPLLGGEVPLVDAPGHCGVALRDGALIIGDKDHRGRSTRRDWRTRVMAWLRDEALMHFANRSITLAGQLGVVAPSVHLSNASGRWGSCTRLRGGEGARIRLHWKLYLMSPHLIDYVVAHELAHIRQLNHSPRFWAEVAKLCPDHNAIRRELNQRGRLLPIL
jgi:predicted metal-dependent hydrolase